MKSFSLAAALLSVFATACATPTSTVTGHRHQVHIGATLIPAGLVRYYVKPNSPSGAAPERGLVRVRA